MGTGRRWLLLPLAVDGPAKASIINSSTPRVPAASNMICNIGIERLPV